MSFFSIFLSSSTLPFSSLFLTPTFPQVSFVYFLPFSLAFYVFLCFFLSCLFHNLLLCLCLYPFSLCLPTSVSLLFFFLTLPLSILPTSLNFSCLIRSVPQSSQSLYPPRHYILPVFFNSLYSILLTEFWFPTLFSLYLSFLFVFFVLLLYIPSLFSFSFSVLFSVSASLFSFFDLLLYTFFFVPCFLSMCFFSFGFLVPIFCFSSLSSPSSSYLYSFLYSFLFSFAVFLSVLIFFTFLCIPSLRSSNSFHDLVCLLLFYVFICVLFLCFLSVFFLCFPLSSPSLFFSLYAPSLFSCSWVSVVFPLSFLSSFSALLLSPSSLLCFSAPFLLPRYPSFFLLCSSCQSSRSITLSERVII